MKRIIYLLLAISFVACETKENFIDTGISDGTFEGSMYAYMQQDSYNWDSTLLVINRAGLDDLFKGDDPDYPQITFWGPTSYSIIRYMLQHSPQYNSVSEIPIDECREMILDHVVEGRYMKADIAFRNPDYLIHDDEQDGGTEFTCLGENEIIAYKEQEAYGGVDNAGPIVLYLYSFTKFTQVPLASPDIQTDNGVVHSLNYNYTFGNI